MNSLIPFFSFCFSIFFFIVVSLEMLIAYYKLLHFVKAIIFMN